MGGGEVLVCVVGAELAAFLMQHRFYIRVPLTDWLFTLRGLADVCWKMNEANTFQGQQRTVFVASDTI